MSKIVTAPLNINDMDKNLESKTVYIFDYFNSSLKGDDFYNYITNSGIISDIYFNDKISYNDKKMLLERYMNENRFLHFLSFNSTIFNIINLYRNVNKRNNLSIFSKEEEKKFLYEHIDIISEWKSFYDSLFYYILFLGTLPENCSNKIEQIKNRFNGCKINNNKNLSVNMVSLLIDDYYFEYYDDGINELLVNYYPYYFENNLYDEKNIIFYLMNPNNYYLKIINDIVFNKEFQKFLETKIIN